MVGIVVGVEVPLIGVGAVVVDTIDVVEVELQPTPSDNRRTSLPVSAQATSGFVFHRWFHRYFHHLLHRSGDYFVTSPPCTTVGTLT